MSPIHSSSLQYTWYIWFCVQKLAYDLNYSLNKNPSHCCKALTEQRNLGFTEEQSHKHSFTLLTTIVKHNFNNVMHWPNICDKGDLQKKMKLTVDYNLYYFKRRFPYFNISINRCGNVFMKHVITFICHWKKHLFFFSYQILQKDYRYIGFPFVFRIKVFVSV